jgi:tetratricopeptide (TPR) repeat protein
MRQSHLLTAVAAVLMAATVSAAGQDAIADCDQSADRARRIAGCSRLIEDGGRSDAERAVAYNNRGNAYRAQGENVRAIPDYSEAIRLRPSATYFYNRGNAHRDAGEPDRAIADYGEAIRLDPRDAAAHNNRGNVYRDRGDLDPAIADHDAAIRLGATAQRLYNRAEAYRMKGDYPRALADYHVAIRLDPKRAVFYFGRGRANLHFGLLAQAQADLTLANELAPKHAYGALWRELGERRNHSRTSLARTAVQLDMSAWPAPVVRMFLGETTPDAVLAAAERGDPDKRDMRVCEARFYIGELALVQGAREEATRLFRQVAAECRRAVVEWESAQAELGVVRTGP